MVFRQEWRSLKTTIKTKTIADHTAFLVVITNCAVNTAWYLDRNGAHSKQQLKTIADHTAFKAVITNGAVNTAWYLDRNGAHLRQ